MSDIDEFRALKSPENKKKNLYRIPKKNTKLMYYIIILLIVSFLQFIIIINLYFFKTNKNNSEELNDIDINKDDNINNNINKNEGKIINKDEKKDEIINEGKIEYKKEENNNQNKKGIHIAMALDNSAVYSTLVSMASALENNDKNKNILIYHLLLSNDFDMNKLSYFESLKKDYEFILNYIKIPSIFKYITKKWKRTETVQYKLLIPLLYPDISRMIFLDGDTLIFKDISEMYDLDFKDNYILGYPFHTADSLDGWEKEQFKIYVNGGVLLINIDEIRRTNMDLKLLLYNFENFKRTHFLEQDTLNYVYKNKIGFLPLKYGVYLFGNIDEYKKAYLSKMRVDINLKELEKAIENPSIVHLVCCNPKVWFRNTRQEKGFNHICSRFQEKFYFYANKTKYYNEIYNAYMN